MYCSFHTVFQVTRTTSSLFGGNKTSLFRGNKTSLFRGNRTSVFGGNKLSLFRGKMSLFGESKLSLFGGSKLSLFGGKMSLFGGSKFSHFGGRLRQIEQQRCGIIDWVTCMKTAVNHENNNITTINIATVPISNVCSYDLSSKVSTLREFIRIRPRRD